MPKGDDQNMGRALGLGFQVLAGAVLGFLVGSWVDRRFQTAPWGLISGLVVGLAAGMYQLIREGIRINKD